MIEMCCSPAHVVLIKPMATVKVESLVKYVRCYVLLSRLFIIGTFGTNIELWKEGGRRKKNYNFILFKILHQVFCTFSLNTSLI